MLTRRISLAFLMLTSAGVGVLAACGGDDETPGATTPPDGSVTPAPTATGSGQPDTGPTTVTAVAPNVSVYYPQAVRLDATGSQGAGSLTYAWTIASAPPGSTASLADASSATPTLQPDRVGTYTLTLTVTSGGQSGTANVTVTVVDPPIFFIRAESDGGPVRSSFFEVTGAAFGDGGTPVSCFSRDGGTYNSLASSVSGSGADFWEAPPGQPSRLAYMWEAPDQGTVSGILFASTTSSTCAAPPTKLDAFAGALNTTRALRQPKISPDGNRVAYVRNVPGGAMLATVGFDGADRRDLLPYRAAPDGGSAVDAGFATDEVATRPVWQNATTLAFIQSLNASAWQIATATDATPSTRNVLMTCTGESANQLDFLANGNVIVSQPTGSGSARAVNIFVYAIDPATKACSVVRNLSNVTSTGGGSYARDFSLSPDRTRVAYVASVNGGPVQAYVAAVDGSSAPVVIPRGTVSGFGGPRWVGGGAYVTFEAAATSVDAGASGAAIAVATPDGGSVRASVGPRASSGIFGIGNGFVGCSFAPAAGSGASLLGMMGFFGLRLLRRREKKRG